VRQAAKKTDPVSILISFCLVSWLAALVPGPDFAIVTRNALVSRRFGVATAGGIASGLAVHAGLATAGLSAILLTSATAFTILKVLGAVYLAVLGLQALLAAVRHESGGGEGRSPTLGFTKPRSSRGAMAQGLLTNVLNPKVVIFFLSLLPQFIPDNGSVATWTPLLAACTVVVAFTWFTVVSLLIGAFRSWLARPRVARSIEGVTGVTFLGFGAKLALQSR
jgi:threonine/homoserine/homoserine lactone efflux protein